MSPLESLAEARLTLEPHAPADFGAGAVERLPDAVVAVGPPRVVLVTDAGLRAAGVLDRVRQILEAAGIAVSTYDDIAPNPTTVAVDRAAETVRLLGAATLVALGGGSVLDVAKGVGLLVANGGVALDLDSPAAVPEQPSRPIVAVPTTAGSGAETNGFGVIEDARAGRKVYVGDASARPRRVILDPELTIGLPPLATAATGMDALVHGIESLASRRADPLSAAYANQAIALVAGSLRDAVADGHDLEARSRLLLGAHLAGLALSRSGLGLVHGIAHSLTNHTGAVHGLALAAVLDEVMSRTADAAGSAYAAAAAGFGLAGAAGADAVVAAVRQLAADVGARPRLRSLGADRHLLPSIAAGALADPVSLSHPRRFDVGEVQALLAARL